jgi:2,2-dialkylglycine decarboxylase (pyruvate)
MNATIVVRAHVSIGSPNMTEQELRQMAEKYLVPSSLLSDIVPANEGPIFARAEGSVIWDVNGKEYLDFNSGQMCSTLGHNNPRIAESIKHSLETLVHSSIVYYNVPQIELAKRIADIIDPPLTRSIFGQSGADSNELAVLLARKATGRSGIGALTQGFHGFTDATRALSFSAARTGYGPTQPDVFAIPTPYCYRCPHKQEGKGCCMAPLDYGMETLDKTCPGGPAAVMIEPIVSAGGVIDVPPEYLAGLRKELDKRGSLLIYDEAQTGLGKLGTMFAYQQVGVTPDIMTLSKHLGGGLAVSAVVVTEDVSKRATSGGLSWGHSHGADPICCAAGTASIDEIVEKNLPKRAAEIGAHWQGRMRALQQKYELIGDIRGRGVLQGIELVRDRKTKDPATAETDSIYRSCMSSGLLFSVRGLHKNVLRLVPPFSTSNAQLDSAADILEGAIRKAVGLR